MRKLLLTTALVGFASAALAADPAVSFTGMYQFQAAAVDQSSAYEGQSPVYGLNGKLIDAVFPTTTLNKGFAFNNKANAALQVKGTSDNGMVYGANVVLRLVSAQNLMTNANNTTRSYLFLESNMGRVEAGSNVAASKLLKVDGQSLAYGTGGASNGDWSSYVQPLHYFNSVSDNLFTRSTLTGEEARKLTWLSPVYNGFQVGLSYTPDSGNLGDVGTNLPRVGSSPQGLFRIKNVVSVGANYSGSMNDWKYSVSASGDFGQVPNYTGNDDDQNSVPEVTNNLNSWNVGAMVGYGNVSAAVSYGSDGKSLSPKTSTDGNLSIKDNYYVDGALAYENGPLGVSLSGLYSRVTALNFVANNPNFKYETTAGTLSVDYALAPGFAPFAEVTAFQYKPSKNVPGKGTNKGMVLILGSTVQF